MGEPAGGDPVAGIAVVRGCWAALLADRAVAPQADVSRRLVAAVLGARHVVQSAITLAMPTGRVLRAGAAVDAAHATTALVLAVVSPGWRTVACLDGAVAAVFAVAGWRMGATADRARR